MLTREQTKVLLDDLRSVGSSAYREAKRLLPMPHHVKVAEKIIAAFNRKREQLSGRLQTRLSKLKAKARHEIYFGTEKSALAAVRKFRQFADTFKS